MAQNNPSDLCDYRNDLLNASNKIKKAEEKGLKFFSTISHEIRTPLNAIIGISELLQEPTSEEDKKEYFKILKQTSETLLELVNNVLDFSKIESGKLRLTPKVFDFRTSINRILYSQRLNAKAKGLELIVDIDENLPQWVKGDSVKVGQIFLNLVSNAVKFTDEGTVAVQIKVEEITSSKILISSSVKDTGIGIPKDQLKTIFEAFNQGSEEINIKYAGTGLGLSISQRLILMMGGELKVESTNGEGAEFSFQLELEKSNTQDFSPLSGTEKEGKVSARGLNVLLAEDNKVNVLVMEKFLQLWGANLEIAYNGLEALEKVQQKEYDLVLMDLQMPVMDGFKATKSIRGLGDKFRDLPIIALTASTENFYREKIKAAGISDFITKPFHPEELLKKLASYKKSLS